MPCELSWQCTVGQHGHFTLNTLSLSVRDPLTVYHPLQRPGSEVNVKMSVWILTWVEN